jgi:hypothetical protein
MFSTHRCRWNIQEVVLVDGEYTYGDILYGAQADVHSMVQPPAHLTHYPGRWTGIAPGPTIQPVATSHNKMQTICTQSGNLLFDSQQCDQGDDACFRYFILAQDLLDFVSEFDVRHLQCSEASLLLSTQSQSAVVENARLWSLYRMVQIENVLERAYADTLAATLKLKFHSEFWQASFWDPAEETTRTIPIAHHNKQYITDWLNLQHRRRSVGQYAYAFSRTNYLMDSIFRNAYPFAFKEVVELLQSRAMLSLLRTITHNNYELHTYFFSRYFSLPWFQIHLVLIVGIIFSFFLQFGCLIHATCQDRQDDYGQLAHVRSNYFYSHLRCRYSSGDFLDLHSDSVRSGCAIVYIFCLLLLLSHAIIN